MFLRQSILWYNHQFSWNGEYTMKQVSRRAFIQTATSTLALSAASYRSLAATSANDKISLGFVGVGGMGSGRLNEFMRYDDTHIAAICDIDESHLNRAIDNVQKRRDMKPDAYHDFRDLIERPDIDAVVVVTPDHWHALPFIKACQAGKDVFVEKPLSYSIGEGRAMLDAARKYERITQLGTHIHNDYSNYRRVVEMVQSGNLGEITKVHCWHAPGNGNMGNPSNAQPPKELDYNFWLGPAPKRDYNPNRSHFNFRYFWDYSGGDFMDFWCHITDVVYWALDLTAPVTVSASGKRWNLTDNSETPNMLEVLYQYPNQTLLWTIHPKGLPGFEHMGSIGAVFQGTKATLVTNYSKFEIYVDGKKQTDFPTPEKSIPDSPGHLREFLNSIKSREKCTCDVAYAHKLNKGGLLGNIAYRTGDTLTWDDEKEKIQRNPKANKLVTRQYRKPWRLG
jgi:predicted dehydrogenase